MNYSETLDWMFQQLPMYQRIGSVAYKADLANTHLLMNALDNPQHKFKSVHIGGTNGKGSTSHMLASVLQEAGYKVGLYTSPHLVDFRERIQINGQLIEKEFVVDFITSNKDFFSANKLSFFEMTVGLAFDYFAKEQVDIAVIEVGMGGRLDSTNVITPLVSAITNISLDHTQFLGDTLAKIATEKAGIIKTNVPCVIGETTQETKAVFEAKAKEVNTPLFYTSPLPELFPSALNASYQKYNQSIVVELVTQLTKQGYHITKDNVANGIKNVIKNTNLRGRWECLQENPKVIADTGHNKAGIQAILEQLKDEKYADLHVVFGMVNDKNSMEILKLLPKNATYYLCKASVPRSKPVEDLHNEASQIGLTTYVFNSPENAYSLALTKAKPTDLIWVGGSTFVVADVLNHLENIK